MKKIFLSTLLMFFYVLISHCQKHDNVWQVGNQGNDLYEYLKLDFDHTPVGVFEVPDRGVSFFWTSASFCDWSGKLLLYTDGERIYDKENKVIEGGGNLKGGGNIPYGAFFLPAPGNGSVVYLFHSWLI